jgi:cardiolipin synthase A/B
MNRTWLAVSLIVLIGACGSLPRIGPGVARPDRAPTIESARGPLPAQRNQALLRGLRDNDQRTTLLERHLAFEQSISESPLLAGNDVRLLQDGPSTYQAMFAAIQAARDHINMETYILEDDDIGRRFAITLIEKQRNGVQVNLIYDSVGSLSTPAEFFKPLADAGVNLLEFNPVDPKKAKAGWDLNRRDHRKLLILDGKTVFLGGINISSVYSGGSFKQKTKVPADGALPWRDTDLLIEGPVVAEFQKLFMQTWQTQRSACDRQFARRSGEPDLCDIDLRNRRRPA